MPFTRNKYTVHGNAYRRGASYSGYFKIVVDLTSSELVHYRNNEESLHALVRTRFPMFDRITWANVQAYSPGDETCFF